MRHSILRTMIIAWATVSICEGQEVFHKDLNDKIKASVSQYAVAGWQQTNGAIITSATEFVLKVTMPDSGEHTLWTNRYYHSTHADGLVNSYKVFDAMLIDGQIQLCYLQGGRFSIEEISSQFLGSSPTNVSRFDLVKGYLPDWEVLTNAVFSITASGTPTLTAQGWGKSLLVWEYRNHEWIIDSMASKSEKAIQRVHDQYEHWMLQSNQWGQPNKASQLNSTSQP